MAVTARICDRFVFIFIIFIFIFIFITAVVVPALPDGNHCFNRRPVFAVAPRTSASTLRR